jgi:hypothetical protein
VRGRGPAVRPPAWGPNRRRRGSIAGAGAPGAGGCAAGKRPGRARPRRPAEVALPPGRAGRRLGRVLRLQAATAPAPGRARRRLDAPDARDRRRGLGRSHGGRGAGAASSARLQPLPREARGRRRGGEASQAARRGRGAAAARGPRRRGSASNAAGLDRRAGWRGAGPLTQRASDGRPSVWARPVTARRARRRNASPPTPRARRLTRWTNCSFNDLWRRALEVALQNTVSDILSMLCGAPHHYHSIGRALRALIILYCLARTLNFAHSTRPR